MAITDIDAYAHLTDADIEILGAEFDAIRRDIEAARGEEDALHPAGHHHPAFAGGRRQVVLLFSNRRPLWLLGTALLGAGKIIENMELGHNVMHGQWDWLNDPEVHSTTWEWDNTCPSVQWKHSTQLRAPQVHQRHRDGRRRGLRHPAGDPRPGVGAAAPGKPDLQLPARHVLRGGGGLHHLGRRNCATREDVCAGGQGYAAGRQEGGQAGCQGLSDLSALSLKNWRSTLTANFTANIIRNYWAYMVIFCGHFPDGAEKFTAEEFGERGSGALVPAADAGVGQFHRRTADAVHER